MREQKHLQRTGSQLSRIALQKILKILGVAEQQFNLSEVRRPKAPAPLKEPKMTNGLHIYKRPMGEKGCTFYVVLL